MEEAPQIPCLGQQVMIPKTQEWWFQLVDEGTGCAFANTEPDMVELPQALIRVRDLRNKIHAEYDHTKPAGRNLLAHVAPNQLKVYGDEAAYKAKKLCSPRSLLSELDAQATLIVVVPTQQSRISPVSLVDAQETSTQLFNSQLGFLRKTTGAVPSVFRTFRTSLVDDFINLLFPTSGEYRPLLFIRAPPLSGKSALCDLLCNRLVQSKPQLLVARLLANEMKSMSLSNYFKSIYKCELEEFWGFNCERVIFIDEAQITYDDEHLWLGLLKNLYERRYEGPRVVLFSSYGSFDPYGRRERSGTPIAIEPSDTFGLFRGDTKLGIQLSRAELDEMVGDSVAAKVGDLIWDLSSAHIGIAQAILTFLDEQFRNKPPELIDASDMELVLRSAGLLEFIKAKRGIPTVNAFERVVQNHDLPDESRLKMSEVMHNVASGNVLLLTDEARTPRSRAAVELLTRYGFLYEGENKQLLFASNMHLKIWLYSNRTDPVGYMVSDISHDDFVVACVKRMSASRLQHFACGNTRSIARERQIQMELYGATVSCLPRDVLVTPEWRTNGGKGFIDLVIRGSSILWFWELLVNGDDAIGHSKRLESGGKYHGSLTGSSSGRAPFPIGAVAVINSKRTPEYLFMTNLSDTLDRLQVGYRRFLIDTALYHELRIEDF
ncbi:unnamed protein product [Phytophthora lilii]|uniref:Unnamed protein product n=1 Tax=Phytophthora lilii TaxID=2077276 RepID=A0A9W6U297_9STRA|nr:unnamed protein product [Phytophthora lilii]